MQVLFILQMDNKIEKFISQNWWRITVKECSCILVAQMKFQCQLHYRVAFVWDNAIEVTTYADKYRKMYDNNLEEHRST